MKKAFVLVVVGISLSAFALQQTASAQEPFLGEIKLVAFNFAPRGFAVCDGQLMQIAQHTALFSLLGTTYGGDGRTTFGLPDLRGRAPIHMGQGPGLTYRNIGSRGGQEEVTLSVANLPAHTHAAQASSSNANDTSPDGNIWAATQRTRLYNGEEDDVDMSADAIGSTGGGQSINNMQPYLTVNYVIALTGIFPSRN